MKTIIIIVLFIIFFILNDKGKFYSKSVNNFFNLNLSYERKNTTLISSINSNSKKKKNLIIGVISKYSWETVAMFFKSIVNSQISNYDCVIFVRTVSKIVINKIKEYGVIIYEIPDKYRNDRLINIRWKLYFDYLNERKDKYNLIFATDIRDTIFQKDIFQIYQNKTSFLAVPLEDGTLQEEVNKNWTISYCGKELYQTIKNERIICVGTILGTIDKIMEFSIILYNALLKNPLAMEQGVANCLFYHDKIFNNCIIKSDNYGPVMTIAITNRTKLFLDKQDNLLNFNNEIASVIHQYDRKPDLLNIFKKKLCPEFLKNN